ncbi:MAG: cupin domain-containing protein [Candidatus Thermoplasmatota archaeon]|nr:cupin domain-containing protein [Candidatus Thermoplasmatota archaeon]
MTENEPVILNSDDVEVEKVEKGDEVFIQRLITDGENAENCFMRRFTMKPGAFMPSHRHEDTDHVQYILNGKMEVNIDGDNRTVKEGDSLYIPVGVPHSYENPFDEEIRFLCIVPSGGIETKVLD